MKFFAHANVVLRVQVHQQFLLKVLKSLLANANVTLPFVSWEKMSSWNDVEKYISKINYVNKDKRKNTNAIKWVFVFSAWSFLNVNKRQYDDLAISQLIHHQNLKIIVPISPNY